MANRYKFTKAGLAVLKVAEGDEHTAYWDNIGKVWTIGYGHTGPDVHSGLVWSEEIAIAECMHDLAHVFIAVDDVVGIDENALVLTNNQYSALCIFAYNVGTNAFENSTLASYLLETDNPVYVDKVVFQMRRWNKAKGKVIQGLVNRREAEIKLWRTPDDKE